MATVITTDSEADPLAGMEEFANAALGREAREELVHILRKAGCEPDPGKLFRLIKPIGLKFFIEDQNRKAGKGGLWPKAAEAWRSGIRSLRDVERIYQQGPGAPWFLKDAEIVLASLGDTIANF